MKKIDLMQVLEALETGDSNAAESLVHDWLVALGEDAQKGVIVENIETDDVPETGQDDEAEEAGDGDHVTPNVDSTTPSEANRDPEAACAVEINAEEHVGYDLESAPEVKDAPGPHFVDFDLSDLDEITKEGDSSAMLNSGEGFGSDSPPSPIAGEEGASEKKPAKKSTSKSEKQAAAKDAGDEQPENEGEEEKSEEEK